MGCVYFDPAVMESMIKLKRSILERGFRTDTGLVVNLCSMVMNACFFIVDPRGKIFRCPAFVGREEFAVGDISDRGGEDFSSLDLWRRCMECPYVPLCGDGCSYAAYVRYGDAARLNCQNGFMEFMVRENLKLNYEFLKKRANSCAR